MKGPLLAEKPSVLPRALKTTGIPLLTARVSIALRARPWMRPYGESPTLTKPDLAGAGSEAHD
jgi:hypothetical protein